MIQMITDHCKLSMKVLEIKWNNSKISKSYMDKIKEIAKLAAPEALTSQRQ